MVPLALYRLSAAKTPQEDCFGAANFEAEVAATVLQLHCREALEVHVIVIALNLGSFFFFFFFLDSKSFEGLFNLSCDSCFKKMLYC